MSPRATPAGAPDPGLLDRLFGVLADPTRRRLLETLVHDGPRTATELAGDFTITRQAVVKHLQVMLEAGMVASEREGRDVRYRATTECLGQAVSWLLTTGPAWDRRLQRLATRAR
ncbi:MAG: metalloregulator ArsR/SmtB family transcription factor [Acidimicrobiales bacterium]